MRKSWRYIVVLLALGLLASLTVVGALAAQPGNGKGNGPKTNPKGRPVHAVGTTVGTTTDALITVQPKQKAQANLPANAAQQARAKTAGTPVEFVVTPETKIVGEGVTPGARPDLTALPAGTRVNVVGRTAPAGAQNAGSNVARIIVLQGAADADDGDD